jgi:hypothetical protein
MVNVVNLVQAKAHDTGRAFENSSATVRNPAPVNKVALMLRALRQGLRVDCLLKCLR